MNRQLIVDNLKKLFSCRGRSGSIKYRISQSSTIGTGICCSASPSEKSTATRSMTLLDRGHAKRRRKWHRQYEDNRGNFDLDDSESARTLGSGSMGASDVDAWIQQSTQVAAALDLDKNADAIQDTSKEELVLLENAEPEDVEHPEDLAMEHSPMETTPGVLENSTIESIPDVARDHSPTGSILNVVGEQSQIENAHLTDTMDPQPTARVVNSVTENYEGELRMELCEQTHHGSGSGSHSTAAVRISNDLSNVSMHQPSLLAGSPSHRHATLIVKQQQEQPETPTHRQKLLTSVGSDSKAAFWTVPGSDHCSSSELVDLSEAGDYDRTLNAAEQHASANGTASDEKQEDTSTYGETSAQYTTSNSTVECGDCDGQTSLLATPNNRLGALRTDRYSRLCSNICNGRLLSDYLNRRSVSSTVRDWQASRRGFLSTDIAQRLLQLPSAAPAMATLSPGGNPAQRKEWPGQAHPQASLSEVAPPRQLTVQELTSTVVLAASASATAAHNRKAYLPANMLEYIMARSQCSAATVTCTQQGCNEVQQSKRAIV